MAVAKAKRSLASGRATPTDAVTALAPVQIPVPTAETHPDPMPSLTTLADPKTMAVARGERVLVPKPTTLTKPATALAPGAVPT